MIFQVGINISPAEQRVGGMGGEDGEERREVDKPPYRHFGVAMATWGSYKLRHLPCQGDVCGAMAAVLSQTGARGVFLLTVTSQGR